MPSNVVVATGPNEAPCGGRWIVNRGQVADVREAALLLVVLDRLHRPGHLTGAGFGDRFSGTKVVLKVTAVSVEQPLTGVTGWIVTL